MCPVAFLINTSATSVASCQVGMYGRATRLVIFGLCIWFGYKLSLFVNLVKTNSRCPRSIESRAALVTLVKTMTVTETITTSFVSFTTETVHSTTIVKGDLLPSSERALTHIVIPIAPNQHQVAKLSRSLRYWNIYSPCHRNGEALQKTVHLILLSFRDQGPSKERRIMDLFQTLDPMTRQCFSSIEFRSANLSTDQDNHHSGSRGMFESVLGNKIGLRDPGYVFWMEPDTVPIREGWLTALTLACADEEPFWIKGSALRHDLRPAIITQRYGAHFLTHINGNALYNMRPDAYPQFYYQVLLPYLETKGPAKHGAFDTTVARFLNDPANYDFWRANVHRFRYTEIIQNRWGESYSTTERAHKYPDTFLIHGGIPMDF